MRIPRPLRRIALQIYPRLPWRVKRIGIGIVTPTHTVGSLLVVQDAERRLLLVRQSYTSGWSLPGGLLDRHESPVDAAVRELLEETGLSIDPGRLRPSLPNALHQADHHWVDFVFFASAEDTSGELHGDGTEILDVAWFATDSLPELRSEASSILAAVGFFGEARERDAASER
ncbi:MAG TPA: NUDIX domain-containing protein [Candidatus Dormibacteraeota bacterium]|jgi:ADP-ribose pyrophosphatase YjhB (NUDIX family)|nr:NUDIX domain-containing protein [Candidatus Dormibacteraeota bacterium]